jgi:predicted GIY-YIG superfamily endonuclease
MHYVYLLRSINYPDQKYSGVTDDLKKRLTEHNDGKSIHTNKFKPWRLVTYIAFDDSAKAKAFEKHLKQGTGHAFC